MSNNSLTALAARVKGMSVEDLGSSGSIHSGRRVLLLSLDGSEAGQMVTTGKHKRTGPGKQRQLTSTAAGTAAVIAAAVGGSGGGANKSSGSLDSLESRGRVAAAGGGGRGGKGATGKASTSSSMEALPVPQAGVASSQKQPNNKSDKISFDLDFREYAVNHEPNNINDASNNIGNKDVPSLDSRPMGKAGRPSKKPPGVVVADNKKRTPLGELNGIGFGKLEMEGVPDVMGGKPNKLAPLQDTLRKGLESRGDPLAPMSTPEPQLTEQLQGTEEDVNPNNTTKRAGVGGGGGASSNNPSNLRPVKSRMKDRGRGSDPIEPLHIEPVTGKVSLQPKKVTIDSELPDNNLQQQGNSNPSNTSLSRSISSKSMKNLRTSSRSNSKNIGGTQQQRQQSQTGNGGGVAVKDLNSVFTVDIQGASGMGHGLPPQLAGLGKLVSISRNPPQATVPSDTGETSSEVETIAHDNKPLRKLAKVNPPPTHVAPIDINNQVTSDLPLLTMKTLSKNNLELADESRRKPVKGYTGDKNTFSRIIADEGMGIVGVQGAARQESSTQATDVMQSHITPAEKRGRMANYSTQVRGQRGSKPNVLEIDNESVPGGSVHSTAHEESSGPSVWRPGGALSGANREEFMRNRKKAMEIAERARHQILHDEIIMPFGDTRAPSSANESQSSQNPLDNIPAYNQIAPHPPSLPLGFSSQQVRQRKIRPMSGGKPVLPLERLPSNAVDVPSKRTLPRILSPDSIFREEATQLIERLGGGEWLEFPQPNQVPEVHMRAIFMNDFAITERIATEKEINRLKQESRNMNYFADGYTKPLTLEASVTMVSNMYQYFRSMQAPLFHRDMARQMVDIFEDEDDHEHRLFELKRIFAKLPKEKYIVCKSMLAHLSRIVSSKYYTPLACLFAPLLFRLPSRRYISNENTQYWLGSSTDVLGTNAQDSQEVMIQVEGEDQLDNETNGDNNDSPQNNEINKTTEASSSDSSEHINGGKKLSKKHQLLIGASMDHLTIAGESRFGNGTVIKSVVGPVFEIDNLWETLSEVFDDERRRSVARIEDVRRSSMVQSAVKTAENKPDTPSNNNNKFKTSGFKETIDTTPLLSPYVQVEIPANSPFAKPTIPIIVPPVEDPPMIVLRKSREDLAPLIIRRSKEDLAVDPRLMIDGDLGRELKGRVRSFAVLTPMTERSENSPSSAISASGGEGLTGEGEEVVAPQGESMFEDEPPSLSEPVTLPQREEDPMEALSAVMEGPAMSMLAGSAESPEKSRPDASEEKDVAEENGKGHSCDIDFGESDPDGFGWNLLTTKGIASQLLLQQTCMPATAAALETILQNLETVFGWNTFTQGPQPTEIEPPSPLSP